MKRLFLLLLTTVVFLGCSKEETPLFIMEYTLDIPFFPEVNTAKTLVVRDDRVRSTFKKMLEENNLTSDDISIVRVRKAALLPLDHNLNYGLLRRIEVNIFDIHDPLDLLPIADLTPLTSENRGELRLIPGLPNIKEYVESTVFGLDVGYSYRAPFQEQVNNRLVLELEAIGG